MTRTQIFDGAATGDARSVRAELCAGVDPNAFHKGQSALHIAAERGWHEVVELLLENGADINAKDSYNRTPLHLAAIFNRVDAFRVLVKRGADTTVESSLGGETVGDIAKLRSNVELQKILASKDTLTSNSASPAVSPNKRSPNPRGQLYPAVTTHEYSGGAHRSPNIETVDAVPPAALSFKRHAPVPEYDESRRPPPLVRSQ
jgi:ankyrin repeat protein